MNNTQLIELSPSSLNLFLECPRCFWLYKAKGIHRPSGPMSSLPSGMDLLIKKYFDKYRALGKIPPAIEGKIQGKLLEDQEKLNNWRSWQSTELKYVDENLNAVLRGGLDECFVWNDFYIPVDYKTRGFDLKANSEKYYQNQLNCYTLLLEANGFKTPSFGYLIFYIPKELKENGIVRFNVEPVKVKTNPQDAKKLFEEAVKLLRGPAPPSHSTCDFCSWSNDWLNFE
jgi:CRISPR/Cas system-associated exonuclease Cas4 (RecB family)